MPRFPVGKRAQPYHRPSDQKSFAFLSKGVQAACTLVASALLKSCRVGWVKFYLASSDPRILANPILRSMSTFFEMKPNAAFLHPSGRIVCSMYVI
jgi:hypothetical protein